MVLRNGVTTSFHQWGIYGVEDYLKSELTASDFIDTYDEENNIEARCKVTPKWNPQDDKETKLEKIITQKWIAMFSEGCEAWAEQRRTGYPRLFPVRFNHSRSGCIDTEIMVRRLNFPYPTRVLYLHGHLRLKPRQEQNIAPGLLSAMYLGN